MADTDTQLAYRRFLDEWHDSREYIVARSSGSTGLPKEIRLLKSDMRRSAEATNATFGITSRSIIGSALPATSIATKMAIVRSVVAGCAYAPVEPSNTLSIHSRIDLLSIAPSQSDYLISHPGLTKLIGQLLTGGAPLSAIRENGIIAAGYRAVETYGMTETCSNVALRAAGEDLFTANPGVSFSLDPRGCLTIHAPGYSFDGIATNDTAELTTACSFRLLGRYDNAINSGGIKIHPEILERELEQYISVPFYVVGAPDDKWGTIAVLVVEGDASDAETARKELACFPDRLRRPRQVRCTSCFSRTHTGKIRRILPPQ